MNLQQSKTKRTRQNQSSTASPPPDFSKFVLPALAVLALLGAANLLRPKPTYQTNLKDLELRYPNIVQSQNVVTAEAPRYGLRDLEVHDSQVNLILWDNGGEDGDFVTVEVNGRVYAANMMLRNSANSIPVALNPGANLVKIHGIRDGAGGITLAAKASNQGNMTNAPFPVGATAMFYILRR